MPILRKGSCRFSSKKAIPKHKILPRRQTGRNHETGRKIVEMCKHYQFTTEEVKPLRKFWHGKDKKITAEEFNRLTGYSGRSSQDMRDAGVIAWVYAGLSVKM